MYSYLNLNWFDVRKYNKIPSYIASCSFQYVATLYTKYSTRSTFSTKVIHTKLFTGAIWNHMATIDSVVSHWFNEDSTNGILLMKQICKHIKPFVLITWYAPACRYWYYNQPIVVNFKTFDSTEQLAR